MRAIDLGRDELWFDEAYSALVAMESPAEILAELARDASPPLYFLSVHFWGAWAGFTPLGIRSFSAVAGVAAVILCGLLGRRLWDERAGFLAALLLALSPLHVYYSREARPYSLLVLLTLGSFLALHRWMASGRLREAALYCLATLAALYTHNYGVFLPGALLLASCSGRLNWSQIGFALGAITAGYLPWIPALTGQASSGASLWIAKLWEATPPALALGKSLAAFSIGGSIPAYVLLEPPWLPRLSAWLAGGLFSWLCLRALLKTRDAGTVLVAGSAAILLGVPFLLSFVQPIYLVGRYDVIALPLFFLVSAAGARDLRGPAFSAVVTLVLGLALLSLGSFFRRDPIEGVERQAQIVTGSAGEHDAVLCTGFTRNTLEYYVRLAGGRQAFYSFPTSFGEHRGWLDERELANHDHLSADARWLVAELAARLGREGRLWIAHSRLLQDANELLMREVVSSFEQLACPADAETLGFTCWRPGVPVRGGSSLR